MYEAKKIPGRAKRQREEGVQHGMLIQKHSLGADQDNNTNINYANVKSKQNNIGIIELGIELDNINSLRKVIACIQSLPDVYSVKRVQTSFSHAPEQFAKKNVKKKPPKKKPTSH